MRLLDLLRGAKPPTSAQLREALSVAEAERAEALAAHDRLQARRAELLLDGDDRSLDAVERDIAQAQRQVDRIDLLTIQAQERLNEAEAAERRAGLDQLHAEAEAKLAAGVAIYSKQWPKHAHALRALALELERLQEEIDEANQKLLRAGDPRQVGEIDRAARPSAPDQPLRGAEPWRGLRLPSTVAADRMFYPHQDCWGSPLHEAARPER
jgi:hypothetical protein